MALKKTKEIALNSKEILKKASRSKPEELNKLLELVEKEIKNSKEKDNDLIIAKAIITSRLSE